LIGHLQTNKAARAVELFTRVQSVDSVRLAEALSMRAHQMGRILPILLEVNVAGEASKSGLAPAELVGAARAIAALPNLRPEGLMTIAPLVDDPEAVRPVFRQLRALRETLRSEVPPGSDGGDGRALRNATWRPAGGHRPGYRLVLLRSAAECAGRLPVAG
jgi:uncharacterized pyridoxal phosphate-containing UPF0001 family protein